MTISNADLEVSLKEHVRMQDALVEGKLKLWVLSAIVAQIIPLVTIAFFIGGIYQSMSASNLIMEKQTLAFESSKQDAEERRRWELAVEIWASKQPIPFSPPPRRTD